jgi:hypothetical protein
MDLIGDHQMTEKEENRIRREFSARLNEALDDMGIPTKDKGRQTTAGRLFGVSQKGARKWLEGEGLPHTKRIPKIAAKVNVRQEWLLFGLGPKRLDPEEAGKFNVNLMQRIMVSVEQATKTGKITLSEPQKAHLITSLYESLSR